MYFKCGEGISPYWIILENWIKFSIDSLNKGKYYKYCTFNFIFTMGNPRRYL